MVYLNDKFKNINDSNFAEKDVHAVFYIGRQSVGKLRTIKVVFGNPWSRRTVWAQRDKIRNTGIYINEEPSQLASNIGYQAREARRRGFITRCKTLPNSVLITFNDGELVNVETMEDFFRVMATIEVTPEMLQSQHLNNQQQQQQHQQQQQPQQQQNQQNQQHFRASSKEDIQLNLIHQLQSQGILGSTIDPKLLIGQLNTATAKPGSTPPQAAQSPQQMHVTTPENNPTPVQNRNLIQPPNQGLQQHVNQFQQYRDPSAQPIPPLTHPHTTQATTTIPTTTTTTTTGTIPPEPVYTGNKS